MKLRIVCILVRLTIKKFRLLKFLKKIFQQNVQNETLCLYIWSFAQRIYCMAIIRTERSIYNIYGQYIVNRDFIIEKQLSRWIMKYIELSFPSKQLKWFILFLTQESKPIKLYKWMDFMLMVKFL